jgi:protocatechuate 3,4-dioxygenase beta subunit
MKQLFIVTLILVCLTSSLSANDCKCTPAPPNETTRAGANEEIVLTEKKPRKTLHGLVRDVNGEALADVLVEVFDNPNAQGNVRQNRLAACVSGADGRFCFKNIPDGKYELILSKGGGWNRSHVYVVIAPRSRKSTKAGLNLPLQVGT